MRIALLASMVILLGCNAADEQTGAAAHEPDGDDELGTVDFVTSCSPEVEEDFNRGVALLHHMMYEQARPYFEEVAEADEACAMAHWGIAMTRFQPLWNPTSEEDLQAGKKAVEAARAIGAETEREKGYLAAVGTFFADPEPPADDPPTDHAKRVEAWAQAQRDLHEAHPDDVDAAALLALSEVALAQTEFSPAEETDDTRRRQAGELLEGYFDDHPEHPGLHHYLIHAYDTPALAHRAEEAAEAYDQLAPNTPHALHMPSHIFVRLGRWEETVDWNRRSSEAALQMVEDDAHAIMHYVHALDYMMYGQLQLGEEEEARKTLDRIREVEESWPALASTYALAAAPARFYLEQGKWDEAASLEATTPPDLEWDDFPAAAALLSYARGLGAARTGDLDQAEAESHRIEEHVRALREEGDDYWAYMSEALGRAVEAWTLYERGDTEEGLALMSEAADLEDSMEKHPITPGEVFPVRELYGELLLVEGRYDEALEAFEASLERTPNRRNALAGMDRAMAGR